jgi:hypothetical protein
VHSRPRHLQHRLGQHVPQPGERVDHDSSGHAAHQPARLRRGQRSDRVAERAGLLHQLVHPQTGQRHHRRGAVAQYQRVAAGAVQVDGDHGPVRGGRRQLGEGDHRRQQEPVEPGQGPDLLEQGVPRSGQRLVRLGPEKGVGTQAPAQRHELVGQPGFGGV